MKKVIVNFIFYLVEIEKYTNPYYNGGWVKKIDAVDRSKSNGYCFIGDFIPKDRLVEIEPGIYIICTVQGSRKHHRNEYYFVRVTKNGDFEKILGKIEGKDWALQARDKIANLPEFKENKEFNPAEFWNDLDLTKEEKEKLKEYIKTL